MNVFLELTRAFNDGELRAVLSSGQAVVLHRLAVMSKDGDWILSETAPALEHVLAVLQSHGARYRFGAPLDVRWLEGGWSSHFEFRRGALRVRTDFVTRPPRIAGEDLAAMWSEQEGRPLAYLDARRLALMKMTNREKDYAVLGELARLLEDPRDRLRFSRSARDLLRLVEENPVLAREVAAERPLLSLAGEGIGAIEVALDAERRRLIHANEERLERYVLAAAGWAEAWPAVAREIAGLPLIEAHAIVASRALGILPPRPAGDGPS